MLPFESFVGLRYTRAKRRNQFISFVSMASMAGIALGVAALIVVMSVMNGFQGELRARILSVVSHAQIAGKDGRLAGWEAVARQASARPEVVGAAPYVSAQGLLSFQRGVQGAQVRGVVPALENTVADLGRRMVAGELEALRAGEFGIVLGRDLARHLGARLGDRVTVISPQGQVTAAGVLPRLKRFRVVGIFEVGMYEYDAGLALMHLADAQRLYRMGDTVSGVRLQLQDLFEAERVVRALSASLPGDVEVTDWSRSHGSFFRAVQIEKRAMFTILSLIVAVAAFNLISTLVMAVADKQADIAILRTLGAAPGSILRIFVVQGVAIGVAGSLIGLVSGIVLALHIDTIVPFLERLVGMRFLAEDVYVVSALPSDLQLGDVLAIAVVALGLSFAATLWPAYRAARIQPASALRYE